MTKIHVGQLESYGAFTIHPVLSSRRDSEKLRMESTNTGTTKDGVRLRQHLLFLTAVQVRPMGQGAPA